MRVIKDALMACTASNETPFLSTLDTHRTECIRLLEKHEHETPDRLWRPGDPQARKPSTTKAKARMKLVLNLTTRDNKPVFPPRNTRLSDEWVYLATKFLKATDRGKEYPYDFDEKGDIDPARIPSGVPPIIWAHGLPFFPVYKGYYILCGREHAKWIGWLLSRKQFQTTKQFPMWTVGPVVAPGSAVELTRTVDRQLRVHKASSTADVDGPWEKNPAARDVVSTAHWDLSVVPILGGGHRLMPIYQIPGYNLRCGPDWENGRSASFVGRETFQDKGVEDFDYDEFWEWDYANEKFPDFYSAVFDSSDSENDEETEEDEVDEQDENQDNDLEETTPSGLQDQDNHQDEQESGAHEERAKALDDGESESDPEEHLMMLNFIQKCRREAHERGESHATNETQNQAEPSTQEASNAPQQTSTKTQKASTQTQKTSTKAQEASNKNTISSEVRAKGAQTAKAVSTGPKNSTTENATANPDHASRLAVGHAMQETRDQAESSTQETSSKILEDNTKKTSTQSQEASTKNPPEASNKKNIPSEIRATGTQTAQAASTGPDKNPAHANLLSKVSEVSERTMSSLKRAMAEYRTSQGAGDMLLPSSKRRKIFEAETDEMKSTIEEDRGTIVAKIDTDKMSTMIVDRSGVDGNKAQGPVSILKKRTRTEDQAPEAAGEVMLRRSKRLKIAAAAETDEVMSIAREVQGDAESVSTEVQAEGTSTNTIDRSGEEGDNVPEIVTSFNREKRRAECEAAVEAGDILIPPVKKRKKTVRFDTNA